VKCGSQRWPAARSRRFGGAQSWTLTWASGPGARLCGTLEHAHDNSALDGDAEHAESRSERVAARWTLWAEHAPTDHDHASSVVIATKSQEPCTGSP